MEYLAEQFFIHSNFSLTPLSTDDILMNHKCFYYIYMYVNSVLNPINVSETPEVGIFVLLKYENE